MLGRIPKEAPSLSVTWGGDGFSAPVPRRISLEDLSPSVVLHMTEKLGYKNSDVINTVLSNRACHILAVYFLLNKKLERYLSGVSRAPVAVLSMEKGALTRKVSPQC